ncbi:MAG: Crp/Fnr family transcriptional regulator [Alphaproteobacteria bacterium]|nr:Crp/Fnr family transcriptional regulator [Alphaproteobacteria bacterium]
MDDLRKASLFRDLTDTQITMLEARSTRVSKPASEVLFFQDDRGDSMYVIARGSVKVSAKTEDGQDKVLAVLHHGDCFGEMTLLDNRPRSATVETLEPCEFIRIVHHDFRTFTEEHPEILWKVLQALCARVRVLSDKALALAYEEVPYRVVKALVDMTDAALSGEKTGSITLHINANDLSNLAGTDRRTAARIIRQLEQQGLVHPQATSVEVPDAYALRRALEFARDWF